MDVPPNESGSEQPNVPPPMMGPPVMGSDPTEAFANYPRYVAPGTGPGAIPPGPPIVRFAALEDAWNLLRAEMTTFIPCTLTFFGLVLVCAAVVVVLIFNRYGFPPPADYAQSKDFQVFSLAWGLPLQVILFPLQAGYFWMCVRRLRGYPIQVATMFEGYRSFLTLAVLGVLMTAFAQLGNLLGPVGHLVFLITQLLATSLTTFASIAAIDQKTGVFESLIVAARGLVNIGNVILLSLFMILVSILLVVPGACTLGIGLIFLMPLYFLVPAIHYHAFFPPQEAANQQPQSYAAPQYSA